jgi:hypothetical protein
MCEMGPRTPKGTGIRLHCQVWFKRSPQSLSPAMSRSSCYGSSLPTPPVVAMGQGMLQLQLQPPTTTSRLRIRRSSPRQESLLRPTTGFGSWITSLGSCAALKCKRPSSSHISYRVMPARGGPTTLPLAPRITKCRGLNSPMPSAPTISQQA